MKIRFNIRSNTKKFSSVDELPPNIREIYERAMASGEGKMLVSKSDPKIFTRLTVNGREVDPTKAISEAEQKLCADVMELLSKAPAATTTDHPEATPVLVEVASSQPGATTVDAGWLTKKQWKLVLMAIVLAAVALTVAMALR